MINVTCAILRKGRKVLICQRSDKMKLPLKWEFPGGKIEEGESKEEGLKREIKEELHIDIEIQESLQIVEHQYPDFSIKLYPYICKIVSGTIQHIEHAQIKWEEISNLMNYDWAEADIPIVKELMQIQLNENKSKKTAILLGATGLTGSLLLEQLLEGEDFNKVLVFTRNTTGIQHPKLEEHIIDLFNLEQYASLFKADTVFCCIGTTKAKTPDKTTYHKIDYGIPSVAAKLAKVNHIPIFLVISALGANSKSRVFYNRVKGKMQEEVLAKKIEHTYILQPSLIVGYRKEKRAGENFAKIITQTFHFLIPKKYKNIQAKTIAIAMIRIAKEGYYKNLIPSDEIQELGNKNK